MSRLWGFVPLACFVMQAIRYRDAPVNLLWICHVAALALAIGLFARASIVVRVAAVLSIVGVPLWLIDVVTNGAHPVSIISHVAAPLVALVALRVHRGAALPVAAYALTAFVIVQQLCRLLTPAELNLNVAHAPMLVTWSYPVYWALTTVGLAALIALVAFASTKLPPLRARVAPTASTEAPPAAPPRSDPGFNVPPKMSPSEWRAAVAEGKASPIVIPLAEAPVPQPPSPFTPEGLPRTRTRGGLVVDRTDRTARKATDENVVPDELLPKRR
jgi:hypothetical protein